MKKTHDRILVLSGSLGDGHMQAAKAILEASQLYKPNAKVEVVDFIEWVHPRTHIIERYCFIQWVKHFPSLYGYLFQKTRMDNVMSHLLKQIRYYSLTRLQELLEDWDPSVVVSTFPPASAALSQLKERYMTNLPTVTVITDHTDHSYWLHPYTDLYLVGSNRVKEALMDQGISDKKIAVTGIPVRPAYEEAMDKAALRLRHGLDPSAFVVLVMGGGWGIIDRDFVEQLEPSEQSANVQYIMVCGRNLKLQQRLHEMLADRHDVLITGFLDNIHEWMAMSDVLITKPGGLTTSEALSQMLPMLLLDPQLGQEKDNAGYLIDAGVARMCRVDAIGQQLSELIASEQLLADMRANAQLCRQHNSAREAIDQMLGMQSVSIWGEWETTSQQYA